MRVDDSSPEIQFHHFRELFTPVLSMNIAMNSQVPMSWKQETFSINIFAPKERARHAVLTEIKRHPISDLSYLE